MYRMAIDFTEVHSRELEEEKMIKLLTIQETADMIGLAKDTFISYT